MIRAAADTCQRISVCPNIKAAFLPNAARVSSLNIGPKV